MLRDYLKVRATINGMNNIMQITVCNRLIKNFRSKWKQEGHDLSLRLIGFKDGVITERFSY